MNLCIFPACKGSTVFISPNVLWNSKGLITIVIRHIGYTSEKN